MPNNVVSPMTALSAAIDRLGEMSRKWSPERILDEGLDIVRDYCWAGSCALYVPQSGRIELVAHRPSSAEGCPLELPNGWFPWGLAPMNPQRFVFVEAAGKLPALPGSEMKLEDFGIESCLHLPILERDVPLGYMQVFWPETRLVWDDEMGRILRTLGRFLLMAHESTGATVNQGR